MLLSAERLARFRATLDRRQPDLRILLDGVHKPHNLSAILRTCDAVGVLHAHAVVPDGALAIQQNCAAGAGRWVNTHVHSDVGSAVSALQSKGHRVYAAHLSPSAVDFRQIDFTQPCAVLLGAELWGVSDQAARAVDGHITVPMVGLVESLNVSVAAAVVLYEAQRQRQLAGFYDQPRLPSDDYQRTLFEWLHPRIAATCQARDLPYPQLDEAGDPIFAPSSSMA
jgi:tRNA (guanosine-2'-O-)-methyltransferase